MDTLMKHRAIRSTTGVLAAILLMIAAGTTLPFLDTNTDKYFREAITKAGLAYATCRVVNATVSVVKESHVELEPAGIGISLAAGQILDPIDDMTERLSDVLVTAITSLGVQKLAHEILVSLALPVLAAAVLVLSMLVWFDHPRIDNLKIIAVKIAIVIVIVRVCLPVSSLANGFIYTHFFSDKITEANTQLGLVTAELEKLKDFSVPEIDGLIGTIENSAALLKKKSIEFNEAIETIVNNMGAIIENLLQLTFIYVALFLIQVIILPLLTFWFMLKVINAPFQASQKFALNHGG